MLRDPGPKYTLGFGVRPSAVPLNDQQDQAREGPNPTGGFVARALYDHPLAKFFAVSAATVVGMGVASTMVRKGGVRLGERLAAGTIPFMRKESQAGLLKQFREVQSVFDEWEGVTSRIPDPKRPGSFLKRDSWIFRDELRARDIEEGIAPSVEQWTFRNEIQQRLVHQARSLPYQLPALYVANRAANNIVGDQNTKVNWKNPFDVIGDFAESSLKNITTLLAPLEVGQGAVRQGWRRIMSEGDFAANTSTFSPHIRKYGVGLKVVLDRMGQDAAELIHQTTRRSSQVAGSFANAIQDAADSKKPVGFAGLSWDRDGIRLRDKENTRFGFKRFKLMEDARNQYGWMGALQEAVPSLTGFARGFGRTWSEHEVEYKNVEAARRGERTFRHRGEDIPVDLSRIRTHSYVTQMADAIGGLHTLDGRHFDLERRDSAYRQLLQEEVSKSLAANHSVGESEADQVAQRFLRYIDIKRLPSKRSLRSSPREAMIDRVNFGEKSIQDSIAHADESWEAQFAQAIRAKIPNYSARITGDLHNAIQNADYKFLDQTYSDNLTGRIGREWKDIYGRVIIPELKRQLGESPLSYETFQGDLTPEAHEFLVRKTAQEIGVPLRHGQAVRSTADLRGELNRLGLNTTSPHEMRAILIDQGAISKPWTKGGFNFLGLRPLTIQQALVKNYFGSEQSPQVKQIFQDIGELDHPYIRGLINHPVGKHVWESRAGRIVDLNPAIQGARKTIDTISRHFHIPFLQFSPLDLTSSAARGQMARAPAIQITSAAGRHFGGLNKELGPDAFDVHVWMRQRNRPALGKVFGHRLGEDIGEARGLYYPVSTMGGGTWQKNLRIAFGDKGIYFPAHEEESERRKQYRRWARSDPEQPNSVFNLAHRVLNGEFGERFLSRTPDIENPAVLGRLIDTTPNVEDFNLKWGRAAKNLEKHYRQFHLTQRILAGIEHSDPELGERFKIPTPNGPVSLHDIRNPHDIFRYTRDLFSQDLTEAQELVDEGRITQDDLESLRASQGFIRKVYLGLGATRGGLMGVTPESLTAPASRSVATAGINTRLDEMRADLYRYLVTREAIRSGDAGDTVHKLLDIVDDLSSKGHISGAQKIEARAAVLSIQANLLGLGLDLSEGAEAGGRREFATDLERSQYILRGLSQDPRSREILGQIANYETRLIHNTRFFGLEQKIGRGFLKRFGVREQESEGIRYNPFGGGQKTVFVPATETAFWQYPWRAVKSAVGVSSWKDPEAFSAIGVRTSHLATRLNRYFQMLGMGVDESQFGGPLGFVSFGLAGRRVLPLVAGTAGLMAADRTLGGFVHGKDEYGYRKYQPLFTGAIATGLAHAAVLEGLIHGPGGYEDKREEYFGNKDVPIRRGRYWPLGSTPWRGGRVMYYRPNWYRRFMSGYQYTPQDYGSPVERLAFDYDFSPLHLVDPYHWERKHEEDRPYPVTGPMFTGPWGPATTALNATVGRVLKPPITMHQQELAQALSNYRRIGQFGMYSAQNQNPYQSVLTRAPSGGAQLVVPTPASYYLQNQPPQGETQGYDGYTRPYNQPYGFLGLPHGTNPETALSSYQNAPFTAGYGPGTADTIYTGNGPIYVGTQGRGYSSNGTTSPYSRVYMARAGNFDPRIIAAANPLNPGHGYYQAGQFGYESEEMAGIYGFGFGVARQSVGLGQQNFSPTQPVLQSAGRAYGAERSWWDLNLGGFGDFPTPIRGEYGNLEFSEIARRFVPHKRREINEINPIPNQFAQQYPWLPGNDYFTNFDIGDPYTAVQEGELQLPGAGYERTHQLHPDINGRYGVLDQQRILGNVAPWSEEYRAIDQIIRRNQEQMAPEDLAYAQETRQEVAQIKKRHQFYPYRYAHSDFTRDTVKVTGFLPGDADQLITNKGVIRLAGVRARRTQDAINYAHQLIHAGDTINIRYDANAPTGYRKPIDAQIWTPSGADFGQALLQNDFGYNSRVNSPLDNRIREGPISFTMHRLFERMGHANTIINQKFYPHRTATEEWERYHIYGTDFPQWSAPYRDFIEPLGYRARNRNPGYAAAVLNVVGRAFGRTPQGRAAGSVAGSLAGLYFSTTSNANTLQTGERYIPPRRIKEMAVEEYSDILNYVKYARLYNMERQQAINQEDSDPEIYARRVEQGKYKQYQFTNLGPHTLAALDFRKKMKQTEYGADLFGDVQQESMAVPKRKRDYFMEFVNAPMNDRARILSTAPRLERRMYEARWGLQIEQRPDLSDYFAQHELPSSDWSGWAPNSSMQDVELKVLQQQGLDASQLGFYPQQVQEANLLNPTYPDFNTQQGHREAAQKLQALMSNLGIPVNITARETRSPGVSANLQMANYG